MNYNDVVEKIHLFLQNKLEETQSEGYIIGVSGGLDSAVATKLAVDAVGHENVHGWVMPGKPSNSKNMKDARELCQNLGLNYKEIEISKVVDTFTKTAPIETSKKTKGNLRARTRMVYEYMAANEKNLLVIGAGNKTEIKIGYFTKWGDGAVDVRPLAELYKTEVKELAKHIELPSKFIEKQPTAGLWEGQTDEGELGAKYSTIDKIMKNLLETELTIQQISKKTGIKQQKIEKFDRMYKNSKHKRKQPYSPKLR